MAMTDAGLSAMIKSKIEGLYGAPDKDSELQNFCNALGAAIVEYIQANAVCTGSDPQGGTVTSTIS